MILPGIKASELVAQLKRLIVEYGDREVFVSTGDYPGGCGGVTLQREKNDPYIPKGVFQVWGRSM